MANLQANIQDVLRLQDTELANAMNTLKADPAKLADFMTARKGELYTTVSKEHSDNFAKVYGDLQRASDTTKNILYYHTRNKDLDDLQKTVFEKAKGDADAAQFDSDVAKRQFEINEWSANNKADTLFFLQLVFIALMVIAPLLYLNRLGAVPSSVFYGVVGLLIIALVMTVVVRALYTNKTRDTRYWNRRQFARMGGPPTPPTCEAIQGLASEGIAGLAQAKNKVTAGLTQAENRLTQIYSNLSGS